MSKPMRQAMPDVTAFIDAFRDAFGTDVVNPQIRKGMEGIPNAFYARENDHEVGTPFNPVPPEKVISLAEIQLGPINPANAPQKRHLNG